MLTIHILCWSRNDCTPKLEPNDELERHLGTEAPTGIVVYGTSEQERQRIKAAYADSTDLDTPDQLKWVEVTPIHRS
jgi:hypothetical protein